MQSDLPWKGHRQPPIPPLGWKEVTGLLWGAVGAVLVLKEKQASPVFNEFFSFIWQLQPIASEEVLAAEGLL